MENGIIPAAGRREWRGTAALIVVLTGVLMGIAGALVAASQRRLSE